MKNYDIQVAMAIISYPQLMVYDWVVHIIKGYYGFTCNQLDCKLIWQSANGPKRKVKFERD
jgi:hypothetical protein